MNGSKELKAAGCDYSNISPNRFRSVTYIRDKLGEGMAINSKFSNNKSNALLFLSIGLMFITLGVTTTGSRLFVLSGVLFILSASITWYEDKKQHKNEVND